MAKPEREFSAVVGQKSMGTAGPEYIKKDLDKAFAMLDPNKTLPDGSPGGIGLDNMQQGAVNDEVIGNREIDDTQAPIGNIGFLSTLLNWIAYVLKSILGTSWRTTPAITLPQVKAHVDAPSPHTEHETKTGAQAKVDAHGDKKDNPHNVSAEQVGAIVSVDGVSNPGGNIDLVAGAGVDLTPDNVGKKITISAKNDSIIPGKHATTHGSGGSDPVTPASIGAATSKHATAHGSGGSDPITPASIGAETPAGAQSKANTAASAAESSAKAYTDTHSGKTTGIHGATSAATASKIMIRDAAGRAKVAAPSAADDIARKDTVDGLKTQIENGTVVVGAAKGDRRFWISGCIPTDVTIDAQHNLLVQLLPFVVPVNQKLKIKKAIYYCNANQTVLRFRLNTTLNIIWESTTYSGCVDLDVTHSTAGASPLNTAIKITIYNSGTNSVTILPGSGWWVEFAIE